jgi:ABC-2 type transport system permease protein
VTALPAGSAPWLLAHEMRLAWRGAFRLRKDPATGALKGRVAAPVIVLVSMVLVGLFGGLPLGLALRAVEIEDSALIIVTIDGAMLVLFTLMLSQTMSATTTAFYERADLDLLLSSPLPPERTLAVRVIAIAGNAVLLFVLLPTPLLLPVALISHPAWLAAYVVLGSLALLASTAGLWLAMAMFSAIGPRRTKTAAQLVAALIGAAIFLVSQSYNLIGGDRSRSVWTEFRRWAEASGMAATPLAWPARAVLGEPLPLLAFSGFSLLVFAISTRALGHGFAANAASAVGADAGRRRTASKGARGRFGDRPFTALVRKEMRLLFRDPVVLSQALLQVLYLLPLAFVLLRNAQAHATAFVAMGASTVVFLAGQLGGTLGWITISGEDSPELLACAPISVRRLLEAKLAAVLIPVFAVLALPLALLIILSPWAGIVATAGCLASAAASGLFEFWRQRPGKRRDFRRQRGSAISVTLIEVLAGLMFGVATGLFVIAQIWGLIPLVLGLGVVWAVKPRGAGSMPNSRAPA